MRRVLSTGSSSTSTPQTPLLSTAHQIGLGLPFLLSVIAGCTDIIGFLGLNGLFTAHITGNLVVLAARVILGDRTVISTILSVPVFVLVLLVTSLMARATERSGGSTLWQLLLCQLLCLLAFLLLGITVGPWSDADAPLAIAAGMCGVAAMAVQNALVQIALRNTPTTAVMTTNVTHLIVDLSMVLLGNDAGEVAKAKHRAFQILPVILGFSFGCGVGAWAEATAGLWALLLPVAIAFYALIKLSADDGTRR